MKRFSLLSSSLAISCLSLILAHETVRATSIDSHSQGQITDKAQILLAQNSSQQEIINTINSLTPAQQQQIASIYQSTQPAIDQKTAQLQAAAQNLANALTPNTPASTLSSAHKQVLTIAQQRNQLYFNRLLKIREILTVQQRNQLNQALRSVKVPGQSNPVQIDVLVSPSNIPSLTPTQQQQIAGIVQVAQPAIDQKTSQLEAALQAFSQSLAPNSSSSAISAAHNQVVTTAIQRNQLYFNRLLKVRDVLTVNQRAQLNQALRNLASS